MNRFLTATLIAVGLSACGINKDVHRGVLADLENTKLQLAETQRQKEEEGTTLLGRIAELEEKQRQLQNQLDTARADLSMYESRTGGLEEALAATKVELDELRAQKIVQERRLAEYRKLTEQLASMVKTGKLQVTVRNGNMVLQLPNNILFESGKAEVKKEGQDALVELAGILSTIENRRFLVAGHTDNVPTSASGFKSNWELSTARSVNVVKSLEGAGVNPLMLAAAGYSEFDPVQDNATEDGKAANRRIEIILMPNLDELPKLPKELLES